MTVKRIQLIEGDRVVGHWPPLVYASDYDAVVADLVAEVGANNRADAELQSLQQREKVLVEALQRALSFIDHLRFQYPSAQSLGGVKLTEDIRQFRLAEQSTNAPGAQNRY